MIWLFSIVLLLLEMPFGVVAGMPAGRQRVSINSGWKFQRWTTNPDNLNYTTLKSYIMPSGNNFIADTTKHYTRPSAPAPNATYAQAGFDDSSWEAVNIPHDWAIKGPFYTGDNPVVPPGEGRLPSQGVGWYRRKISIDSSNLSQGRSVFLDMDGAMAYAVVWLNGALVGGWPYGYASFQLDLTPYVKAGDNQLAIRLDNALESSRFYPGAGIYRNVWLTTVSPAHVAQWGTKITTPQVSSDSATVNLVVQVENSASASNASSKVDVVTEIYTVDASGQTGDQVAQFPNTTITAPAGGKVSSNASVILKSPKLWGPRPNQQPNMYVAITKLYSGGQVVDSYETRFGIRNVQYTSDGLHVNNQRVYLQGVCQHHDLGSLGSAFNVHAARRQLEMLRDMGTNAIRTSHNPPAPELLDLADEMGFVVLDEIFDTWQTAKVTNDFHLIFNDWHEPDLRAFVRRDRNHPSVWAWSVGNEVAEQGSQTGANICQGLKDIVYQEDGNRAITIAMNSAGPTAPVLSVVDLIGLNYQGEGQGQGASPRFPQFRSNFPNKMIFSTESSSAISSRGTYLFPVASGNSVNAGSGSGQGEDTANMYVSAYDIYAVTWGASPDKVFAGQDQNSYAGGEFVWTGWDYIGEPTPYDGARSSYFGIIDLAGNPKDRYWLYQSRWNPDVKMAHILPHWNWPSRTNQTTPVHVFTSGDEAELFVNGKSQGRQTKAQYTYRFRWDKVVYQPGEVRVVTYKNGSHWADATVRTTGTAKKLRLTSYRNQTSLAADGSDLVFITASVTDDNGDVVPTANNAISFSVAGPGEIVATDNGDPTDYTVFPSTSRKAFNGYAMAIVRAKGSDAAKIVLTATSSGLATAQFTLNG